jgi:hypothetical protein
VAFSEWGEEEAKPWSAVKKLTNVLGTIFEEDDGIREENDHSRATIETEPR